MPKLQSRITPLKLIRDAQLLQSDHDVDPWALRDDELGGFWGTKFRKYASILDHCRSRGISHIIATGGINSNNLAAAAVLCAAAGIKVSAFAIEDHGDDDLAPSGNRFLLRLALPPSELFLIPRSEKKSVSQRMHDHQQQLSRQGIESLILEEGGGSLAAVPGLLTLAEDIARERMEWPDKKLPQHIFIDSGTGLSAAVLAAGLFKMGKIQQTRVHIVQMAGFEEQIHKAFEQWVTPSTGVAWQDVSSFVRIYRPLSPRSYGATSHELFAFIRDMARHQGLLLDPIYSGKLFMRAFDLIKGQNCRGRILIIHTGGISGLMGFPQIVTDPSDCR